MPLNSRNEKNTVIFHNFYKFYNSIYILIYVYFNIELHNVHKNYILIITK